MNDCLALANQTKCNRRDRKIAWYARHAIFDRNPCVDEGDAYCLGFVTRFIYDLRGTWTCKLDVGGELEFRITGLAEIIRRFISPEEVVEIEVEYISANGMKKKTLSPVIPAIRVSRSARPYAAIFSISVSHAGRVKRLTRTVEEAWKAVNKKKNMLKRARVEYLGAQKKVRFYFRFHSSFLGEF